MRRAQRARTGAEKRRPTAPEERRPTAEGPVRQAATVNAVSPELASGRQAVTQRETIAWTVVGLVAFLMRIWDVGHRAMHHDESLHAVYSWNIVTGHGYHYDPMMHGPYQFHQNALFMGLFNLVGGNLQAGGRMGAVLCGTALVLTPFLLRRYLGRNGAFVLALLFCFSPFILYFSRFMREDMPFALWTMLSICAFFKYLEHGRHHYRWLFVLGAALALLWSTKESSIFVFAILGGYAIFLFISEYQARASGGKPLLTALSATPLWAWAAAVGVIAVVLIGLYWPIGNDAGSGENPLWAFIPGLAGKQGYTGNTMDVFTGGLNYWIGQQKVARGSQPWFYYLLLVPLYEQVAVVFGLWGVWYAIKRRTVFSLFVVWWALCTWAEYIYASEKMPWLGVHLTIPLLVLASMVITRFLVHAPRRGWRWWLPAVVLLVTSLTTLRGAQAVAYSDGDVAPREMMIYVQSSQDVPHVVNYTNALAHQLGLWDARTNKPTMRIAVDSTDAYSWPFAWYFRDYPIDNGWSGASTSFQSAATTAHVMTVSKTNMPDVARYLHNNWVGQEMVFNWWFPEDYKCYAASSDCPSKGLSRVWSDLTGTNALGNLWSWWAVRQPFTQQPASRDWSGSRILYFLVRKEDAARVAAMGATFGPLPTPNAVVTAVIPADKLKAAAPLAVAGKGGPGNVSFGLVEGVAADAAHNLYVVDNKTNQVFKFDTTGKPLTQWGSLGSANGQFKQPNGVAVDREGNVYVADTWNGRVQKFSSSGGFITAWGSKNGAISAAQGEFYGPRGIAVAPNGDVAVADTGNKRIEVFSSSGVFRFAFGSTGSANGQFNEPAAVVADSAGNYYVADYWNGRIQKFTGKGVYLAQWAVPGWVGQNYNEPYLAVDARGRIIVPDPTDGRILIYSPTGALISALGGAGVAPGQLTTPLGVTTDGAAVWVGDQGNARIQKLPLP